MYKKVRFSTNIKRGYSHIRYLLFNIFITQYCKSLLHTNVMLGFLKIIKPLPHSNQTSTWVKHIYYTYLFAKTLQLGFTNIPIYSKCSHTMFYLGFRENKNHYGSTLKSYKLLCLLYFLSIVLSNILNTYNRQAGIAVRERSRTLRWAHARGIRWPHFKQCIDWYCWAGVARGNFI